MADAFYTTHLRQLDPAAVGATYLRIYDANDVPWFLAPGAVVFSATQPNGRDLSSPERWYWFEIKSSTNRSWLVFPNTLGVIQITTQMPTGRAGQGGFHRSWVLSNGTTQLSLIEVSDVPALSLFSPTTYVQGSHVVMVCPRCQWVGHVDRSNALRRVVNGRPQAQFDLCPRDGAKLTPQAFRP